MNSGASELFEQMLCDPIELVLWKLLDFSKFSKTKQKKNKTKEKPK